MLSWALTFLLVALIAAVFGFTGVVSKDNACLVDQQKPDR